MSDSVSLSEEQREIKLAIEEDYSCFVNELASSKYSKATGKLQTITLPSFSDATWGITPISLATLARSLSEDIPPEEEHSRYELVMEYTFRRKAPSNANTTSTKSRIILDDLSRCLLARRMGTNVSKTDRCRAALNQPTGINPNDISKDIVILPSVYSSVLHLPSVAGSSATPISLSKSINQFFGLSIQLKGAQPERLQNWCIDCDHFQSGVGSDMDTTPTLWWEFNAIPPVAYFKKEPCSNVSPNKVKGGIFFAVNSDRSFGSAAKTFTDGGILGLLLAWQ